jgi:hypothetical protein
VSFARPWSICLHPSARFTPGDNPQAATAASDGLQAHRVTHASAPQCRAVNHALAAQDMGLERAVPSLGRRESLDHGCNWADVTPVGAYAAEVYVGAVCKLSPREPGMVDRCIAEPYAQSWSQRGMQIFQPHNLCPFTICYEARNSVGSVDATGKFSTAGGQRSRAQPFIGGGPDQQLPRLQPPQGHRQSDDGNRSLSEAMRHKPPPEPQSPRRPNWFVHQSDHREL